MVAISLTHDSVKEMANRLRQFLAAGGTSIKQTHAYEALAKTLGYRDWNTLLGVLQSADSTSQHPSVTQGATAVTRGATANGPPFHVPATLLLIDRHAMAAHAVTVAQIEAAFRRDFPKLLDERKQWETLCHEQLPLRELPRFRPPVMAVSLEGPEKTHFHDALMDCMKPIAQSKWVFGERLREGAWKFTFFFFPEQDIEKLLPEMREALSRLPAEIAVSALEKIDPNPDHPAYGRWRNDGVSYFVWAWETDIGPLGRQLQVASMPLKFNGDTLIRLRDIATLHAAIRDVPVDPS